MNKRILSAVMALVLLVSLVSVAAFAEECNHYDYEWNTYKKLDGESHIQLCDGCHQEISFTKWAHNYVDGVCKCGAKEPAAQPCKHKSCSFVSNDNGTHNSVCNKCGATVVANIPCDKLAGSDACPSCGYDRAPKCYHTEGFEYVSNENGTHSTVCKKCEAVVFEQPADCYLEDGVCITCGWVKPADVCHHNGNNYEYVSNENGTHNTLCLDCNTVTYENADCYLEDGVCITCGWVKPADVCHHNDNNYEYVSNENGTHNTLCLDCDTVIFENAECAVENGVCVACGWEKPADVCHHNGNNFEYISAGDGTHCTKCLDCDTVIFEGAACHFEDGVCVACGASNVCHHNGNNYEYVSDGSTCHSTVCLDCGEVIFEGAPCYFEDGVCVACGASEKCFHAGNNYEYVSDGKGHHCTVCLDCDTVIFEGANCYYENGVCVACGAKAPAVDTNGVPKTGDNSNMTLWVSILLVGSVGLAAAYVSSKKVRI